MSASADREDWAVEDAELIARFIEEDASGCGAGEARVAPFGVSVWALIAHLRVVAGDVDEAAEDYDLPQDAVKAAVAYYRAHKAQVDAAILVHAASAA